VPAGWVGYGASVEKVIRGSATTTRHYRNSITVDLAVGVGRGSANRDRLVDGWPCWIPVL